MELVEIGKIINTFGIKGDLKIASSTDFGECKDLPLGLYSCQNTKRISYFEISKIISIKDLI